MTAVAIPICDTHRTDIAREDCAVNRLPPYYYDQIVPLRRFGRRRINALFKEP